MTLLDLLYGFASGLSLVVTLGFLAIMEGGSECQHPENPQDQ